MKSQTYPLSYSLSLSRTHGYTSTFSTEIKKPQKNRFYRPDGVNETGIDEGGGEWWDHPVDSKSWFADVPPSVQGEISGLFDETTLLRTGPIHLGVLRCESCHIETGGNDFVHERSGLAVDAFKSTIQIGLDQSQARKESVHPTCIET